MHAHVQNSRNSRSSLRWFHPQSLALFFAHSVALSIAHLRYLSCFFSTTSPLLFFPFSFQPFLLVFSSRSLNLRLRKLAARCSVCDGRAVLNSRNVHVLWKLTCWNRIRVRMWMLCLCAFAIFCPLSFLWDLTNSREDSRLEIPVRDHNSAEVYAVFMSLGFLSFELLYYSSFSCIWMLGAQTISTYLTVRCKERMHVVAVSAWTHHSLSRRFLTFFLPNANYLCRWTTHKNIGGIKIMLRCQSGGYIAWERGRDAFCLANLQGENRWRLPNFFNPVYWSKVV